jgi:ferredoxin-NADP reductase
MAVTAKVLCTVNQIVNHGRRVYTLELLPRKPIPRFLPGQFLHLAIDEYDPAGFWPESRSFSIASSPLDRNCLRITYSVVGRFTERMERELRVGRQVWVKLPYGDFVIGSGRDAVLFAGGTGITAFTAFLESLSTDSYQKVTLFYGAKNSQLLIYRGLTEQIRQKSPLFRVFYFCEDPTQIREPLTVENIGRLSLSAAWPLITDPYKSDYYLSGPPGMLKTITRELLDQNLSREVIHIDAW